MKLTFSLPVISLRRPAISCVSVSPSMTQGPAIRNNGRSMPAWKWVSCTGTSESELRRIHVPTRGSQHPILSSRTRRKNASSVLENDPAEHDERGREGHRLQATALALVRRRRGVQRLQQRDALGAGESIPEVVAGEDRDGRDAAGTLVQRARRHLAVSHREQVQQDQQHDTRGGDQHRRGQERRQPAEPRGTKELVEGIEQTTEL